MGVYMQWICCKRTTGSTGPFGNASKDAAQGANKDVQRSKQSAQSRLECAKVWFTVYAKQWWIACAAAFPI